MTIVPVGSVAEVWNPPACQEDSVLLIEPRKRFFVRHQLRFRALRNQGMPVRLYASDDTLDAFSILSTAVEGGQAELVLKKKDVVRLTKIAYRAKDKMIVMLFRRSDPDASAPIFEHRETKKLRKADKAKEEAVAVSAHLFVHLDPVSDAAHPTYHAIMEEVPGISRTFVETIISDILREKKYLFEDRRGEKKETCTIAEIHGEKSEKFGNAMKDSSVQTVTLVRPGSLAGLDTEGLAVPRDQRMRVLLKAKPEKTMDVLKKLIPWARKNDWKDVLVKVDMPEDRSRVVSVARDADASDVLFVRSEQVEVNGDLDPCTEEFNTLLIKEAKDMFARDGI